MKDVRMMIKFIEECASAVYGKDVLFYDFEDDTWYSRHHSGYISFEEVIEWLEENVLKCLYEEE